jgi:ribosomal protein S27AE
VKPTKPQNREFCGKCHAKDTRETREKLASSAPKIDMAEHGEKYVCWQCHYPHSPEVEN